MLLPLVLAVGLAILHLVDWRLRFFDAVPRSAWLSFAGGVSAAYVFMHLLPELASLHAELDGATGPLGFGVVRHVWFLGLVGLVAFYGLELLVDDAQERHRGTVPKGIFWIHIAGYALYNVLIGYLLEWDEGRTATGTILFALAMGFHFLVNDASLRSDHPERYGRHGRWLLAGSVLGGCLLGIATTVPQGAIAALLGLLGGSVVLNAMKEELPETHESRFVPFLGGAAVYTAILLAV